MTERRFRIQGSAGLKMAFRSAYELCQQIMGEGAAYELVLRPMKSKRSIEQNKRYHALLRDLAAVAWIDGRQYSKDAWHEWAKREFIGWEDTPGGGQIGISTTTLTIEQFGDFMLKIEEWAAANGWPLMTQEAA